jgi:hypothetical protein
MLSELCGTFKNYVVCQYSETNVMHFLFSLLRITGLYMAAPGLEWNWNWNQSQFHSNPGAAN